MTTASAHRPTVAVRTLAPFAIAGTVAAAALTAIGTIGGDQYDITDWLTVNVPIVLVATALVFGLVVPPIGRSAKPSTGALVLGVLAVGSVLAFYLGLPAILAAAAGACATIARTRHGHWTPATTAAVALAAVATAAAVALAFTG